MSVSYIYRQVLRKDIRNSYRCVWDSEEQAGILWRKIEPYIPTDFSPRWKPLGLNKRSVVAIISHTSIQSFRQSVRPSLHTTVFQTF